MKTLLRLFSLSLAFAFSPPLLAQAIEDYRGGWMADIDGARHIYYIVLRNDTVSGVYCFDCDKPNNLALIDDGELDESGLHFTLYHYPENASPYQEQVESLLIDKKLHLSITGPDNQQREVVFHRTPQEDKIVFPFADFRNNMPASGGPRILPGPAETITAENVVGMWLWGTGPTKQYFFFMEHKGGIRGMVCGPCFSVNDMAPLEQITMEGTNFHFEITHEDNGGDFSKHGPHSNVTNAMISKSEMLMNVIPSFASPDTKPIEMTLIGPIVSEL